MTTREKIFAVLVWGLLAVAILQPVFLANRNAQQPQAAGHPLSIVDVVKDNVPAIEMPALEREHSLSKPSSWTYCIAATVYGEARGESALGQAAVVSTILNRMASEHYPIDACQVVLQKNQFAGAKWVGRHPEKIDPVTWGKIVFVVLATERGDFDQALGRTREATNFFGVHERHPAWAHHMRDLGSVGGHHFFQA